MVSPGRLSDWLAAVGTKLVRLLEELRRLLKGTGSVRLTSISHSPAKAAEDGFISDEKAHAVVTSSGLTLRRR